MNKKMQFLQSSVTIKMIAIHFTVKALLTTQDANKLSNRNREEQTQKKA